MTHISSVQIADGRPLRVLSQSLVGGAKGDDERGGGFFRENLITMGEHIDLAVQQCDVMLVLIGDEWLTVRMGKERNRLFDPQDFVRAEIEAAFHRAIPVIPVLVENAEMPAEEHLPGSIRNLIYRNSAELRAGRDFNSQMARLVEGLGQFFQTAATAGMATPTAPTSEPLHEILPPRTHGHPVKHSRDHGATSVAQPANAAASKSAESSPTRVRQAIRETFAGVMPNNLFVEAAIPQGKLRNALSSYASHVDERTVVLLYDFTTFGSAKNGVLLTENALYWRNPAAESGFLRYEDIDVVELIDGDWFITVNGKKIMTGPRPLVKRAFDKFLREVTLLG